MSNQCLLTKTSLRSRGAEVDEVCSAQCSKVVIAAGASNLCSNDGSVVWQHPGEGFVKCNANAALLQRLARCRLVGGVESMKNHFLSLVIFELDPQLLVHAIRFFSVTLRTLRHLLATHADSSTDLEVWGDIPPSFISDALCFDLVGS
ncbi:hypothetical protein GH714_038051 [Hevea brasiliensis]|uniref:Uncharacterized protein n=1 Tax=Hevea brasiliensis TaxID=3981 RepID=A0A6A6KHS2_HEVBR|nr:hypothetical protein GH714_038051 [Hevea brasiliensis]